MNVNVKLLVGQTVGLFVIMALALFIPAGTPNWSAGWVFLLMFFGFFVAEDFWLLRHNPGLLQERLNLRTSDEKGWDKWLFPLLGLFPIAVMVFSAFDAVRFHWSPVAAWLQVLGGLTLIVSFYLFFLTFRENSYLSPVVRIQTEREHKVISSGPYRFVRHPMYTGILVFAIGTPLLLGSVYGVLPGLILVIIVARRAVLEEQTLHQELSGYDRYMAQVKYRFVPYIW